MRSPIGFDFRLLRRAKFVAPPPSSPPRSPVDFADLRRCTEGVLPTDPGVAAGAIEGVRPIEPGVRSARSDAIVASFVGGDAPASICIEENVVAKIQQVHASRAA